MLSDEPAWQKAVLNVDEGDTEFAFLDSGPVDGGAYKTLVFVHGHTYHSNVFSRLFPLAANYKLRIIALNRRDYVGSTPFSKTELDDLHCDDVDRLNAFMRMRGLEIACFLVWAIRELELPLKDSFGNPSVTLVGWSLGNITTIAFLCHVASYPPEIIQILEQYLGIFYIYDFAFNGMGYEPPPGAYHPLTSAKVPHKDSHAVFHQFIWTYYQHPSLRDKALSGLHMKAPEGVEHASSYFSPEEFAACTDGAPANRSETQFYPNHRAITPVLRDQFMGAILLDGNSVLSGVAVHFLYCTATIWTILWGTWTAEKEIAVWKHEGKRTRAVTFETAHGENHFFHYDHPVKFLELFSTHKTVSD